MRRIAAIVLLVVAVPSALAFSLGANGDGGSSYLVRAVFDNASFVVPGEDVKIAGVRVGQVESLDVTDEKKAAIVLEISESGFQPFHADATCTIRPQSLIGERYVECTPGSEAEPELAQIAEGEPGAGQRLLPLESTSSPVDIDLVNNIMRLPYRQRFAIIINEFGTALAGRGDALNEAIHRANPALRETDKVLAILARQNRILADLASDSDAVIAPLARRRERVGHFVEAANETGQATAERSADITRTFDRLPAFLRELDPTLRELGNVSEEMTPVLADLETAAPDLNRFTQALGPFSEAGTPALVTLGEAADIGRPALVASRPSVAKLADFAENGGPVGKNLVRLANSLDETGGVERIMDYLLFQMLAVNGFDGVSRYLRAALVTNLCSSYAIVPVSGCNANFTQTESISSSAAGDDDPALEATRKVLATHQAPQPKGGPGSGASGGQVDPFDALRELTDPKTAELRGEVLDDARDGARSPSPAYGPQDARDQALDYLLGSDR
jgi:ABC-type transporter Mla subunit MlaD